MSKQDLWVLVFPASGNIKYSMILCSMINPNQKICIQIFCKLHLKIFNLQIYSPKFDFQPNQSNIKEMRKIAKWKGSMKLFAKLLPSLLTLWNYSRMIVEWWILVCFANLTLKLNCFSAKPVLNSDNVWILTSISC